MIYFELFMYGIEQMDKLMKLSTLILEGMQTFDNQGFEFGLNSLLAGTAESVRMVDGHGFRHEFAQVFNFGGGDLLQVMIGSAENVVPPNSENTGSTPSHEPVWIPFAEDIIPAIDMESKEIWITPLICLLPDIGHCMYKSLQL